MRRPAVRVFKHYRRANDLGLTATVDDVQPSLLGTTLLDPAERESQEEPGFQPGELGLPKSADEQPTDMVVTSDDIAELVSLWTGVPIMAIAEEESDRLLRMEESRAAASSAKTMPSASWRAVRRARAGLKDPRRPVGSFVFVGLPALARRSSARLWQSLCSATTRL